MDEDALMYCLPSEHKKNKKKQEKTRRINKGRYFTCKVKELIEFIMHFCILQVAGQNILTWYQKRLRAVEDISFIVQSISSYIPCYLFLLSE